MNDRMEGMHLTIDHRHWQHDEAAQATRSRSSMWRCAKRSFRRCVRLLMWGVGPGCAEVGMSGLFLCLACPRLSGSNYLVVQWAGGAVILCDGTSGVLLLCAALDMRS